MYVHVARANRVHIAHSYRVMLAARFQNESERERERKKVEKTMTMSLEILLYPSALATGSDVQCKLHASCYILAF